MSRAKMKRMTYDRLLERLAKNRDEWPKNLIGSIHEIAAAEDEIVKAKQRGATAKEIRQLNVARARLMRSRDWSAKQRITVKRQELVDELRRRVSLDEYHRAMEKVIEFFNTQLPKMCSEMVTCMPKCMENLGEALKDPDPKLRLRATEYFVSLQHAMLRLASQSMAQQLRATPVIPEGTGPVEVDWPNEGSKT